MYEEDVEEELFSLSSLPYSSLPISAAAGHPHQPRQKL